MTSLFVTLTPSYPKDMFLLFANVENGTFVYPELFFSGKFMLTMIKFYF